jgi:serine protease Do
MLDSNNRNEEQQLNQYQHNQKNTRSKVKGFFSMLTAGVLGSALTLTILPYTGYFQEVQQQSITSPTQQVETPETQTTAGNLQATQTSFDDTNRSVADIVEDASKAIVGIVNLQQQNSPFANSSENVESGSGTGVIFKQTDDSTYIVTNNHVVEGASQLEISLYDGEKTTAELIGADALTDLAVLKIDGKYGANVLEFGDSSSLRAGDEVLAIGNPLGLDLSRTVTQGIISAVDRSISVSTSAGEWDLNVIQTDAAINPGNSGGALINTEGEVIGINSLKISNSGVEGLGFAIPSNDLIPIVSEIIETGKVERPYIGIGLANLEEIPQNYLKGLPIDVNQGVMITSIDPNSAAAKAGVEVQDVIVAINGQDVDGATDLRKYLYSELSVGDEVTLTLYRQGEKIEMTLTLTSNSI